MKRESQKTTGKTKNANGCGRCGKEARPGSSVVERYGRGGRIHAACLGPEEKLMLANGSPYENASQGNATAGKGMR